MPGSPSLDKLILDLKEFEGRKVVLKELRREIRKPVPKMRAAVKAAAVAILPHRGGLGAWVAAEAITAVTSFRAGRSAAIRLKGSRKSTRKKSDLTGIDAGGVRAPAWGHMTAWHAQSVTPGFFTKTIGEKELGEWRAAIDVATDRAAEVLNRG